MNLLFGDHTSNCILLTINDSDSISHSSNILQYILDAFICYLIVSSFITEAHHSISSRIMLYHRSQLCHVSLFLKLYINCLWHSQYISSFYIRGNDSFFSISSVIITSLVQFLVLSCRTLTETTISKSPLSVWKYLDCNFLHDSVVIV